MNPRDRLIVALDVASTREALDLVAKLSDDVSFFKVGLQLYTAAGPEVVRAITASGANVFLDLKLHDIPTTVAKAVAAAGTLGVKMLTIHLSGGRQMAAAAVAAKADLLLLLGVTVLTSGTDETLRETGVASTVDDQVVRLTEIGLLAGISGFVTSPHETESLRARAGERATIVTPGVRPVWAGADDQRRFMTPREAVDRGADYLVIGRPITAHRDPREAVAKIVDELSEAPQVA
ncbi:MAG: orotidine-5'-phosphate decarboxylase [Chthoniobacterales bacterium]